MIQRGRHTARLDGDFVVFLIGMRLNQPLRVDRWWSVASAMPKMIRELQGRPELGLLHAESWFARTIVMIQYWRSMDQLLAYAKDREAAHLPAWSAFNRAARDNAAVGIWHETYAASPGSHESIYVDMPRFGLGAAGEPMPVDDARRSARERLDLR